MTVEGCLRSIKKARGKVLGELDRGGLKVSKFKSKTGWVLSCDFWPSSAGHSSTGVCSGENKQGWRSFLNMLDNFGSREEYVKWFSRNHLKHIPTVMESNLSYADKVEQKSALHLSRRKLQEIAVVL